MNNNIWKSKSLQILGELRKETENFKFKCLSWISGKKKNLYVANFELLKRFEIFAKHSFSFIHSLSQKIRHILSLRRYNFNTRQKRQSLPSEKVEILGIQPEIFIAIGLLGMCLGESFMFFSSLGITEF